MHNFNIGLAVAAIVMGAGPASAASDARALELIAAAKQATGGANLDRPQMFHERGVMTRDGKQGAYETYGDLWTLRSHGTQTFDGKTSGGGFDGQVSWHSGPGGTVQTATDAPTLRGERLGTYLTLSGFFYPDRFPAELHDLGRQQRAGRSYDVVSVTPKDADSADLWFDAATHRLGHIEATAGGSSVAGDVGDYRLVDGTWVGFSLDMVDGGHSVRLRLESFVYEPKDEAKLAMPKGR
jgi:hypothetical protein